MAGEFSVLRGMMQAAREERYDEAGEGNTRFRTGVHLGQGRGTAGP